MKVTRLAVPVLLFPGLLLAGCGAQKSDGIATSVSGSPAAAVSSPKPEEAVLPSPEVLPADRLSKEDMTLVRLTLPLINNAFPYRLALKPDPKAPLGLNRPPTNQFVLRQITSASIGTGADRNRYVEQAKKSILLSFKGLIDDKTIAEFFSINESSFALPDDVYSDGTVLEFAGVNMELAKKDTASLSSRLSWWEALADTHPRASVLVSVSKPLVFAKNTKAIMSATVDTNEPDRFVYYYLFGKYNNEWVVTNSITVR